MNDLLAFLRARLSEDEAEAKASADADTEFWADVKGDGTHFARHDPARVLREVEAKRALLAGHEAVHRCDWGEHRGGDFTPCKQVAILAAIYRDHPDYDPA